MSAAAAGASVRTGRAVPLALLLLALLAATGAASLAIGITAIPARDLPAILFGEGGERVHRIVAWDLRLPRFLLGALVGAMLALAGALLQDALRNPLAEPSLLGVSSGASLVVATVVIFGIAVPPGSLPVFALAGGLVAGLLILGATRIVRDPVRTILIGAALAAFFSAGITVVVVLGSPDQVRSLYAWLTGSLIGRSWDDLARVLPWAVVAVPVALLLARPLNLLRLGEEMAEGLGLPVARTQALIFLTAILLTAPVVAAAGPIGFVALIAPHMARGALGTGNAAAVLPVSALLGAVLLSSADLAAREVLRPAELPVGLVATAFGAPVALFLLRRLGRRPA
jgi:iron complex transport system permease protein